MLALAGVTEEPYFVGFFKFLVDFCIEISASKLFYKKVRELQYFVFFCSNYRLFRPLLIHESVEEEV